MKKIFPILLLLLLLPLTAYSWSGKVVGVTDGDTIKVLSPENQQVKIRLYGIDTPEKGQPYATAAQKYLAKHIAGELVEVNPMDTDRYNRTVSLVFIDDLNVNAEMVRAGYAWVYQKYCKEEFCREWLAFEGKARDEKQGLWQELNAVPPWEWRRK